MNETHISSDDSNFIIVRPSTGTYKNCYKFLKDYSELEFDSEMGNSQIEPNISRRNTSMFNKSG